MRTLLIFLLLAFGASAWGNTPEQIAQWKEDAVEKQNLSASDPRLADELQEILVNFLAKVDPEKPTRKEK